MSFWEQPPRREPEEHDPAPPKPWWGAPSNELGVAVPIRLVLARTDSVAVALTHVTAFSTGIELRVVIRRKPRPMREWAEDPDPFAPPFGGFRRRRRSEHALHFGVQFADGRKATSLGDWFAAEDDTPEIVLRPGGGGGGDTEWHGDFWLWPLPPPGPLAFVVEWPAEQIPFTRVELDAQSVLDAARESEQLWPEQSSRRGGLRFSREVSSATDADE